VLAVLSSETPGEMAYVLEVVARSRHTSTSLKNFTSPDHFNDCPFVNIVLACYEAVSPPRGGGSRIELINLPEKDEPLLHITFSISIKATSHPRFSYTKRDM
jgi:hypothetical protein